MRRSGQQDSAAEEGEQKTGHARFNVDSAEK
jgi:hypothetical protein